MAEAYFVGKSVVRLVVGGKCVREAEDVGGRICGVGENVVWEDTFPPTHPPTTSPSLKRGKPQEIWPQNWLPPQQTKKRASPVDSYLVVSTVSVLKTSEKSQPGDNSQWNV